MLHSSEILGHSKIKNQFPVPKNVSEKGVDAIVYIPAYNKTNKSRNLGMIDILKNQTHLLIGKPKMSNKET